MEKIVKTTDKRAERWRMVKFLFFSVSAGLIEMLAYALLSELPKRLGWGELPYWFCYLSALVLSVLWNFTLNRKFTFHSAANVPVAMLKVFGYYLVFAPLSTLLGDYLKDDLYWNGYLVTGINMVLNFVTEYLFQRYFVFGKSLDTNAPTREQQGAEQ